MPTPAQIQALDWSTRKPTEPHDDLATLRNLIATHRQPIEVKMTITQTMAIAMLQLAELGKRNRRLSKAWVSALTVMMEEKRFNLTHQGIAFDVHGNLRDGQHRLAAIVKYGKPVEMFVAFGLPEAAFEAIDQGMKRTTSSMLNIDQAPRPGVVAASVAMLSRLEGRRAMDQQAILRYARQLLKRDDLLARSVEAASFVRGYGQSSAFAVAHYQILQHSAHVERLGDAKGGWWLQLIHGHELKLTDPLYVLRRQFANPIKMLERAEAHQGTTQYALQVAFAAAVILAWNATLDGRSPNHFLWRDLSSLPDVK